MFHREYDHDAQLSLKYAWLALEADPEAFSMQHHAATILLEPGILGRSPDASRRMHQECRPAGPRPLLAILRGNHSPGPGCQSLRNH